MKWLWLLLPALLLGACAPSTPASRIAARPADFAALSEAEQDLVVRGRIDEGMPESGVALAWGSPDQRFEGHDGQTHTSRWDYSGSRPVVLNQWAGIYGFNGFGVGPWGCGVNPWVFGPDVVFVPYRQASVWFRNGRVARWERLH